MGNEQVREREFLLQVFEQVQHLRLNRYIERGDRLIGDDQLRVDDQRASDADALALSTAESCEGNAADG